MKKIIFICRANLVRSQIAEALFMRNPIPGWKACSYGVSVTDLGIEGVSIAAYGNGSNFVVEAMLQEGIDIAAKTCTQLLPEHLHDADKIIVMAEEEYVPTWLAGVGERWDIPNPNPMTQQSISETVSRIKHYVTALQDQMAK